jgi:hypothetical protein
MSAPYPSIANQTDIGDMFSYANTVSDGIFGIGILISLWLVVFSFLHMKGEDGMDCAVVAGFFTAIIGVFLLMLGLINGLSFFFALMSVIIPAVWSYYRKSG